MLILLVAFFVPLIIGVPVAFCLGISGVVFLLVSHEVSLEVLPTVVFGGMDSFPLMAIPFFILAGDLMERAGVLPKLMAFANSLVSHLRGGLAYVTVLSSMLFAGVTGASVADMAAVGSAIIPSMIREGYPRPFSAAVTACAATMGAIVPPSVAMILIAYIYGGEVSVIRLFLAGAVPGMLIGVFMMGIIFLMARRRGFVASSERFSLRNVLVHLRGALLGLLVPVIILGGILGGVFTPTEAGAVATAYALFIGVFVLRTLKLRDVAESLLVAAKTSSIVFLLLGTAKVVAWILISNLVPQQLGELMHRFASSPHGFLLLVILVFFLLGFVMEGTATMIMLVPVFAPIARSYGIDAHHLSLIIVMTVQIALITPPVALGLFIVAPMAGCEIEDVVPELWPFMLAILAVIVLVTFVPDVAMWLPDHFPGR